MDGSTNPSMGWEPTLRSYVAQGSMPEVDVEQLTQDNLAVIYEERRNRELVQTPSLRHIPRFFTRPADPSIQGEHRTRELACAKLQRDAKVEHLLSVEDELLDEEDLAEMEECLQIIMERSLHNPSQGVSVSPQHSNTAPPSPLSTQGSKASSGESSDEEVGIGIVFHDNDRGDSLLGGGEGGGEGRSSPDGDSPARANDVPEEIDGMTERDATMGGVFAEEVEMMEEDGGGRGEGGGVVVDGMWSVVGFDTIGMEYADVVRLRQMVSDKVRTSPLLTARTFMRFPRDRHGRVSIDLFLEHAFQYICVMRTHVNLHFYDTEGKGFLGEEELENYVYDLIPSIASLRVLEEKLHIFYLYSVIRRIMFFLDPRRHGKIPIEILARSYLIDELQQMAEGSTLNGLRRIRANRGNASRPQGDLDSEEGEEEELEQDLSKNSFCVNEFIVVYEEYLALDKDQNGMLSKEELLNYVGSQVPVRLTPFFVQRVFEEVIKYKGTGGEGEEPAGEREIDYKTYLEFVLAMENRKGSQGLQYLWKLLDVDQTGRLTADIIHLFLRDIVARLRAGGIEPPHADDVKDEIFDMVKPKNPEFITLKDLISSGVGHIVVSLLVDVNGFWSYDNRENIMNDPDEDSNSGSNNNASGSDTNNVNSSAGSTGGNDSK